MSHTSPQRALVPDLVAVSPMRPLPDVPADDLVTVVTFLTPTGQASTVCLTPTVEAELFRGLHKVRSERLEANAQRVGA